MKRDLQNGMKRVDQMQLSCRLDALYVDQMQL